LIHTNPIFFIARVQPKEIEGFSKDWVFWFYSERAELRVIAHLREMAQRLWSGCWVSPETRDFPKW
jgi:hypothetical protein